MFLPKIRDSQGFTLIETMATLALLTVVIGLVSLVVLNTGSQQQSTGQTLTLHQTAAKTLAGMQQAYYAGDGTGELTVQLPREGIQLESLTLNGTDTAPESVIPNVDFDQPLVVDAVFKAGTGEELVVNTAWRPETNPQP